MATKKKIFITLMASIGLLKSGYPLTALNYLAQSSSESVPQLCTTQDFDWYEKSGADSVTIPQIESQSMFVQADTITGQNKQTHIAQGHVIGYKESQTITSDWLIYDQAHDRATLGDNYVLTREYDAVQGKWADYYLDLNKGTFTQARAFYNKENISATGESISTQDSKHMTIDNGFMTACNPNDPAWYIKSNKMTFDYQNSEGTARNATMYFESIPIFASPYMTFPLGERKSGWLTPNFGGTSTAGTMFSEAYYWNMAPNYDMTITPEYWTRQGLMITDKFRYMTESNVGSIYTEQVPDSYGGTSPNTYRYYWSLNDTYSPMQYVTTGYNYNVVSDNNYFNDFGNFYSVTDNVNLEQSAFAQYKPSWGLASVKVVNYQTLYPYGYGTTIPIYSSYPAINFNVNDQDIGSSGLKWNLLSQYTNFQSPAMQSGERTMLYPSVKYPFQSAWGYATPKFGYSYTYYNVGADPGYPNSAGQLNRALPITSLDTGLYFDRPMGLSGGSYTQTFEPRAYYLYIPEQNQSNLPIFDTATATYNYNQLFSENRFSGYDRINMANDITIGGTTRILNDANGTELMNFSLGYRYYITPENNFLYGNTTQDSQLFLPTPNLIAELNNNWSKQFSTNANFQYDTVYDTIDAWNVGMKFNPDDGKILTIGYGYQYNVPLLYYAYTPGQAFTPVGYENQYALNVAGQWPIYDNIYAVGRTNYDFTRGLMLNFLGGLEYNGGCYTVSAVYQQFIFNYNQVQQNYLLNFSFKGIGNVGSGDPSSNLKIGVPGYIPVGQLQQNQFQ
jgi:LPS-assembly protein